MTLKIITLNIEGSKHLNKVLPFLKDQSADVICLQEVFDFDFPKIKNYLGMDGSFYPMSNRTNPNTSYGQYGGKWGVCILTNLPHDDIKGKYYVGTGETPIFGKDENDDRVLVHTTVEKDNEKYTITTTHFYLTLDGMPTKEQWDAFNSLLKILKSLNEIILCGDFNAPRGRPMFKEFEKYYKDNLPLEIDSTIDTKYHKVKTLKLVVDTFFTTEKYMVSEMNVFDGLSDHKALVAKIILSEK